MTLLDPEVEARPWDQQLALDDIAYRAQLAYLLERSPFYRRFHHGSEGAGLTELPVLTKAVLMDHFDEISTDRTLRLADVEAYLEAHSGEERFRGRYWVAATSGSTGRRSIIPTDAHEWATVIAGYARANEWAGVRAGPRHRTRMAVVSSTTSWHQSSQVAASIRSPFVTSA